jgi:hypothetical protein
MMTKVKKFLTREKAKLPPGFLDQKRFHILDSESELSEQKPVDKKALH